MTHTVATLVVPSDVFELVHGLLTVAGYQHALSGEGDAPWINMTGLALAPAETLSAAATELKALRQVVMLAHEAWQNDRDTRLGKLLVAALDPEFRARYLPNLGKETPNG